ncbi:hypothetical protein KEU06_02470 [Pseudaminobacter sp. 19-2017]|uniref:Uncharacterized protein n=1 Tax=Pseudaminobacter soli (ex Zhang et al. 2022) TaxID=2831468 RepID=A0A942DVB8_9HYPH|nr:hypothetical protein [Pseudaminobacter soli]MBS3647489.1 hypothetical protein [Pseudaminobacter soli]
MRGSSVKTSFESVGASGANSDSDGVKVGRVYVRAEFGFSGLSLAPQAVPGCPTLVEMDWQSSQIEQAFRCGDHSDARFGRKRVSGNRHVLSGDRTSPIGALGRLLVLRDEGGLPLPRTSLSASAYTVFATVRSNSRRARWIITSATNAKSAAQSVVGSAG